MKLPNWLSEDKSMAVHSGREHFLIRNRGVLAAVLRTFRNKPVLMVTSFLHPVSWLLILFIFLLTISLFLINPSPDSVFTGCFLGKSNICFLAENAFDSFFGC